MSAPTATVPTSARKPRAAPALVPAPQPTLPHAALFGAPPLVAGEDAAAYDALTARIAGAVAPADVLEEMWVRDVVDLAWEALRLRRLKALLLTSAAPEGLTQLLTPAIGAAPARELAEAWAAGGAPRGGAAGNRAPSRQLGAGASAGARGRTLHVTMETAERPVAESRDISMLHRIDVYVIDVSLEVRVVADCMLSKRRCQIPVSARSNQR
jgi:hypothetical protein